LLTRVLSFLRGLKLYHLRGNSHHCVQISNYIASPLLTAAVLVIAFAQCFFTLLQLDCSTALATSPVCSVRDAYRIVYMLSKGESLVDPTGVNHFSTEASVLVTSFFVLFTAFVLALLLTILLGASQLDFDQIASSLYWEPMLGFILSTGNLSRENSSLERRSFDVKKAHLWDVLTQTLLGSEPTKGYSWFICPLQSRFLTRVIAVFVVPIWIILGAASLGLLWPPQIRLWLFRPTTMVAIRNTRLANEESRIPISEMRNEILQMKYMAYERSCGIENELREMKELLISAIQE
jgi:hypothetical protein